MVKILLASHGPLAKAMKDTAAFLLGENENVHSICAYVDEASKDLQRMVDQWQQQKDKEDTWIVLTDVFGGSVNNEFMNRLDKDCYYLIAGMNLPLLIALISMGDDLDEDGLLEVFEEAKEAMVYCNPMLQQDTEDEEF